MELIAEFPNERLSEIGLIWNEVVIEVRRHGFRYYREKA
jgi:hypothetical protein